MTDHRESAAQPSASPRSRKRFALTGHSPALDSRVDAARGDLADLRLADRIFAPHYAAPVARSATRRTPLLTTIGGDPVSELLHGERFDVLELSQGYAWGVGSIDGAVGFVARDALAGPVEPTHIVCAWGAALPIGSRLTAEEAADCDAAKIRPLDRPAKDFVAIAETLVSVPAVPGGRSGDGVDAGGLVVLSLSIAGIRAPRFVDLQAAHLGHAVACDAPMLRGDLIFSDDLVAIVADDNHAILCGMDAVTRAPIASLGPIDARRRLP